MIIMKLPSIALEEQIGVIDSRLKMVKSIQQ
jgi:hypothetical protein